jgi:hypothetical protein
VRVLGEIGAPDGVAPLVRQLARPAAATRLAALRALGELRRRAGGGVVLDGEALRAVAMETLGHGLRLAWARGILVGQLQPRGVLGRELGAQIETDRQVLYHALALAVDSPAALRRAFLALRRGDALMRDQARELVKALLGQGALQAGAVKLLDDAAPWPEECHAPPLEVPRGGAAGDAIGWLWRTGDAWMVAALRHDPAGLPTLGDAAQAKHPTIAEDPMESTLETVLFLKDVALFEALSNAQLGEVARLGEEVELAAGAVLFRQDELTDTLYLVREGKLKVVLDGNEIAHLGAGECIGEVGVLAESPRSATVSAITPCRLLRFDALGFLALLDSYPEIGRALMKTLAQRLLRAGQPTEDRPSTMMGLLAPG